MSCTVSFQSSKLLWALVRLVSLWQTWQFSVAIALPSPSGNSTTALAGAGVLGAAASGDEADGAGATVAAAGVASLGGKFTARYFASASIFSGGRREPRSIIN